MDELGIVSGANAPPKKYYLLEKSQNQGDSLLITGK